MADTLLSSLIFDASAAESTVEVSAFRRTPEFLSADESCALVKATKFFLATDFGPAFLLCAFGRTVVFGVLGVCFLALFFACPQFFSFLTATDHKTTEFPVGLFVTKLSTLLLFLLAV